MPAESHPTGLPKTARLAFVGPPKPGAAAEAQLGITDTVQNLLTSVRDVFDAHVRLALLETQYAGQSLAMMVLAALLAAGLLFAAWLSALALVAVLLAQLTSFDLPTVLLTVCLINLALFALAMRWIRHRSRALLLPLSADGLRAAKGHGSGAVIR